jgi:gluconokinase
MNGTVQFVDILSLQVSKPRRANGNDSRSFTNIDTTKPHRLINSHLIPVVMPTGQVTISTVGITRILIILETSSMNEYILIWILIGVSGSGKSTIARLLSEYLECDFLEGDRRHSQANIIKMSSGQPLDDEDRRQWLAAIKTDIRWSLDRNREVVITCSALKAEYRKQLTSLGRVQLVWIDVPTAILEQRLEAREDHYMSTKMLASQLDTFELIKPEENIITIDGSRTIDNVMIELISKVTQQFPSLQKPWYQR